MSNCKECDRPLEQDEKDLCPSCKSTKSHKKKRWTEIIGGVVVVVAVAAFKLLTGGKNGGNA